MNRYLSGLLLAGAGIGLASACVKDPTASIRTNAPARITPSNRFLTVNVGDSVRVSVTATDEQGNVLADPVTATSLDQTTVAAGTAPASLPLPQTNFFIKAMGFGAGRVEVSLGPLRDTIRVNTLPATARIAGQADTLLRSGATVQLTAEPLGASGAVISGVTPITWATSNATVATVSPAGLVTGRAVGLAEISLTIPGATARIAYQVVPGAPASARFASAFGAVAGGATSKREVQVLDAFGNQNRNITELLGLTINSSNPGIAAVATQVIDTAQGGTRRQLFVTLTGGSGGVADITGTVTTSVGTLNITPASTLTVLNPQISSTVLSSAAGATVSITGTGLSATGFPTTVSVDGERLGSITVVSAGQIDAEMPSLGTAGTFDVVVTVGGVASNVGAWTQTGTYDELEASNDDPGTPTALTVPFDFSGAFEGAPEEDDFFAFTLTSDATVLIDMNWVAASKDLDILVTDIGFTAFECVNGATGARPEHAICPLPAGSYLLWLNDYGAFDAGDTTPTTYTVTGRVQ